MVDNGYMTAADAVNQFNRNRIAEFAALSNPAMIRLTYEMDTAALTARQKQIMECYATPRNIESLIKLKDVILNENVKKWPNEKFCNFVKASNYLVDNIEMNEETIERLSSKEGQKILADAIEMYRARQDIENYESDYEYDFRDNTIEIKGSDIKVEGHNLTARILDADDPRNFTVGYDTNCCQHYDSAGEDCTYYATSHPDSAIWVIEEKGKIVAQAFVWTNEEKDTFVFDNIEFANDRDSRKYLDIL